MSTASESSSKSSAPTFAKFLQDCAPGSAARVTFATTPEPGPRLGAPASCLRLPRFGSIARTRTATGFAASGEMSLQRHTSTRGRWIKLSSLSTCVAIAGQRANCTRFFWKEFSDAPSLLNVRKVGEWPPFGPRTPARVINLIGPDRELFLKVAARKIRDLESVRSRITDGLLRIKRIDFWGR